MPWDNADHAGPIIRPFAAVPRRAMSSVAEASAREMD